MKLPDLDISKNTYNDLFGVPRTLSDYYSTTVITSSAQLENNTGKWKRIHSSSYFSPQHETAYALPSIWLMAAATGSYGFLYEKPALEFMSQSAGSKSVVSYELTITMHPDYYSEMGFGMFGGAGSSSSWVWSMYDLINGRARAAYTTNSANFDAYMITWPNGSNIHVINSGLPALTTGVITQAIRFKMTLQQHSEGNYARACYVTFEWESNGGDGGVVTLTFSGVTNATRYYRPEPYIFFKPSDVLNNQIRLFACRAEGTRIAPA